MKLLLRAVYLLWMLLLTAFLLTGVYYIACHYMAPLSRDQWHMLYAYYNHGLLESSLTAVSAHRHILAFLLYDIDLRCFGGSNSFLIVVDQLLHLALVSLLAHHLWREMKPGIHRWLLASWIVVLWTWLLNIALLGWGFNGINNYLGMLPFLLAITCLQRAVLYSHAGWLVAAVGAGLLSTFSFGNGFLVWPSAVLCLYLWRAPARFFWMAGLAGVAAIAGYFLLPGAAEVSSSLQFDPLQLARFPVRMMGGPLYHLLRAWRICSEPVLVAVATGGGLLVVLATIALLVDLLRCRPVLSLWQSLCVALICIGAGTTVLLTFTRGDTALDPWVDRYQIWALLVWLGCSNLYYLRSADALKKYWHAVIIAFPLAAFPAQLDWGARLAEYGIRVNNALLSYAIYLPVKADAEKALHFSWSWKLPYFFDVFERIRAQQRNIFLPEQATWYGRHWQAPLNLQPCALDGSQFALVTAADLLHDELPTVQQSPASARYRLQAGDDPAQVVAHRWTGSVSALQWTYGVVLDSADVVRGLAVPVQRSLLPRANGLYTGGDDNAYAIWRVDGEPSTAQYRLVLFAGSAPRCVTNLQ